MTNSSSPRPQTGDPADGEADGTDPAPSQADTSPRASKAPRRYEVPETDALADLPNRPHANTVRGQIQRVRLDLLARENERLDHQLRELRQQQKEYQEKDTAWREGWQKRLVELSQQVDHLIAEAEASREAQSEQDDGPELRDTVKPLLLAVLEMLDDTEGQGQPVGPDTARAMARAAKPFAAAEAAQTPASPPRAPQAAPTAPPSGSASRQTAAPGSPPHVTDEVETVPSIPDATGLGPDADKALPETRRALASTGRMTSWDPVPAPSETVSSDRPPAGTAADTEPAAAHEPAEPASGPRPPGRAGEADMIDRAREATSGGAAIGDDMSIEIARLLLPQGDPDDNEDLLLEPREAIDKGTDHDAPPPQTGRPDPADQSGEALVLGTGKAPEIEPPQPTTAEPAKPRQDRPSTSEDRRPKPPEPGKDAPSRFVASGLDRPVARRKPEPGGQTKASEGAAGSSSGSLAKPNRPTPQPEPEVPTEPLPKCLTERWEDADSDAMSSAGRGQPAQRRDKGSYRWPFRRLRATIDHDHAQGDAEAKPEPPSRPRGNTRFGEKLE